MALPSKVYQVLVGVFAALGSFLYGYDLTIVAEGSPPSARLKEVSHSPYIV